MSKKLTDHQSCEGILRSWEPVTARQNRTAKSVEHVTKIEIENNENKNCLGPYNNMLSTVGNKFVGFSDTRIWIDSWESVV